LIFDHVSVAISVQTFIHSRTCTGVGTVPFGTTSATTLVSFNARALGIADNQLYVTSAITTFFGVSKVGTGLPTSMISCALLSDDHACLNQQIINLFHFSLGFQLMLEAPISSGFFQQRMRLFMWQMKGKRLLVCDRMKINQQLLLQSFCRSWRCSKMGT
jgi:hypothetical protein